MNRKRNPLPHSARWFFRIVSLLLLLLILSGLSLIVAWGVRVTIVAGGVM